MRKIILFMFIAFTAISANAQFTNTKWKGTLELDPATDVLFDFRKDTAEVFVLSDNSSLEIMVYTIKGNELTLQKITGKSDCDESVIGKYKFEMKNDEVVLTRMDDGCDDRGNVLDKSKWTKVR
jgi:hypothetical protein